MTDPRVAAGRTPFDVLRATGMTEGAASRAAAHCNGRFTYADAMNLAAFYERLVDGGIPATAADAIAAAQSPSGTSRPHDQADAVVSFVEQARQQGMNSEAAVAAAVTRWTGRSEIALPAGDCVSPPRRSRADIPARESIPTTERKGRSMTDHEKRNGVEAERAKLEKERERLEKERERLEQEREKLEKLQEEMEARIERQEERLEEMENELDAREEELDGREEELEELEVEGAEGIREVLDVVSERIPNLMRGIQETVYSPENLKKTSDALVGFFKNLVDAGMDSYEATEMTKMQMLVMQKQGFLTAEPLQHLTRFRPGRRPRPAAPAAPAGPAEPAEPAEPKEPTEEDAV
ncbi:MAG: hypothetical protein PHU43_04405 [Candidatus Bipolaricaulis sp.]|nr:hypothetical protein [Candidatus Bipolaricaulis sp.]